MDIEQQFNDHSSKPYYPEQYILEYLHNSSDTQFLQRIQHAQKKIFNLLNDNWIMKLKYFKIFLFFLCISCGYTNKEISQIVKEWQNKEIIFPYSLQSKIMGKDTACNYLLNKK